jgi:hypothetical protein
MVEGYSILKGRAMKRAYYNECINTRPHCFYYMLPLSTGVTAHTRTFPNWSSGSCIYSLHP